MRRRHLGGPEDSVAMRVVVALAVEVGLVALAAQGGVPVSVAVTGLVLAPLGYAFSHVRRTRPATITKIAISIGFVLALAHFLQNVRSATTVDAARLPLASLFVWVQVLHAFDVPRRRDLGFSMVSSTTLVAAAGALSLSTTFIWYLLAWAGLSGGWLWLSSRPLAETLARPVGVRHAGGGRRGSRVGSVVVAAAAATAAATLVFLVLPRLPATFVRTPPFSLGDRQPVQANSAIDNPTLANPGEGGVVDFSADAYPGFSSSLDLRARGQLSRTIAFLVRADQPALWRGQVFDTYDGVRWTVSDLGLSTLSAGFDGPSQLVPPDDLGRRRGQGGIDSIQTFYMASQQANVILGAYQAKELYFPSSGVRVDRYGSMRSPILLDDGLIYSVVSSVANLQPDQLRGAGSLETLQGARRYLQLPAELPQRVGELGAQIVRGAPTEYDAVLAVQSWLQRSTVYDLSVPREPPGVDAVDHFLFETRHGFCEHIASAMAILLRTQGIPTRVVTGYGPGQRNLFTGYFEVQYADAHAWVEVYYPGLGWVPYDPTFGVPAADPSWTDRLIGPEALSAVARAIGNVLPESVKRGFGVLGRGLVAAVGTFARNWALVVVPLVFLGLGLWLFVRRRRRRRPKGPKLDDLGRAFEELIRSVDGPGSSPDPSRTPSELLEQVVADPTLPAGVGDHAGLVVRTFERDRFAPPGDRPDPAEVEAARASVARVKELVRAGSSRST